MPQIISEALCLALTISNKIHLNETRDMLETGLKMFRPNKQLKDL